MRLYLRPLAASLSKFGVGIGPPNVLEAPKPTSSVRISRMFGAPFGACTSLGKSGLESFAVSPILPWNFGSGLGRTLSCPPACAAVPAFAFSDFAASALAADFADGSGLEQARVMARATIVIAAHARISRVHMIAPPGIGLARKPRLEAAPARQFVVVIAFTSAP